MTPLQTTLIVIASALAYLTMMVVVGAALTARITRNNRRMGNCWNDDQRFGVAAGSLIWIAGLAYLAWVRLAESMANDDPGRKCILCGTNNDSDSAHCKHCGDLMGAENGVK